MTYWVDWGGGVTVVVVVSVVVDGCPVTVVVEGSPVTVVVDAEPVTVEALPVLVTVVV